MRCPALVFFFFAAAMLPQMHAETASGAGNPDKTTQLPGSDGQGADIATLIAGLSDDSFQKREEATRELWKIGSLAIPALRDAANSDDPEISLRATDILEKVELKITPETPDDILQLIQKYREASQNQKSNYLSLLKRKGAFFQVLKLYSMERPELKMSLASSILGVAISGARESLIDGDANSAIELLRISAGNHNDLMALACVYRNSGLLDEQLENLDPPENVPTEVWKSILLQAKGDLEEIIAYAKATDQVQLLAAMRVLSGDPVLWLEQNGLGDDRQQAPEAYTAVALKRWKGKTVRKSDLTPLEAMLESGNIEEKAHGISALASLGILPALERIEAKDSPSTAFAYFLSQERIPEALEALGLDPEMPDFEGWVAKRFELLTGDEDRHELSLSAEDELLLLAGFLERRGLHEGLSKSYGKRLSKYAQDNQNHFLDFLRNLFDPKSGAPEFAARAAAEWAGEDKARWEEILIVACGEEEITEKWLGMLAAIEPDLTGKDLLNVAMALFQISNSPGGLREEWLGKAWNFLETLDDVSRREYIQAIRILCVDQGDVENALKAWDRLSPEEKSSSMWGSIDKYLSAAGRWQDAAEILRKNESKRISRSPEIHAYLAVNLRRAGMEKEAKIHDQWAEKLALGYSASYTRIAAYYSYGGDHVRAAEWSRKAVIQADVHDGDFVNTLDGYASAMFQGKDWRIAASCYEALVQVYAAQEYVEGSLLSFSKARLNADLAKALAILPQDKKGALALLNQIHANFMTDGVLADDFFPLVREAGLLEEHKVWFEKSWQKISEVAEKYPASDNTRNTAAWYASRAGLQLDAAQKLLQVAIDRSPEQPAYLDTMAEIKFAQGDRSSAIAWSDKAVKFQPLDPMIRRQNERFKFDPLPQ
ncbi:tetratricopeptide repeat protein [Luteolibacter algae]|uniref:Tetratricopeptide repeat protein n=1 Tax=Luteolibacter algae TaxID=454151 RepID=A0ABW5D5I6_9BACT